MVAACLLAVPATAVALPPDPPVTPVAPADGATLPADAAGIPVSYQCPPYTSDFYIGGGPEDYLVRFSDGPGLGPDGLLAKSYGSDVSGPVGADGNCTAVLDTDDSAGSPEIVGGRVYWQVYRPCTGCGDPQLETAPPRSFVVRPSITGTLRAPKRIYAGYLGVFALESEAKLSGAQVRLQRRAGRSWKTVAKEPYRLDRTELFAKLPAGRQALRLVVAAGGSSFPVASKTVTVRRGGRRATSGRDDGRYVDRKPSRNSVLRFKVAGGGKTLRDFKASLSVFCVGPTVGDNRIVIAYAALRSARVAPDGSVTGFLETSKGARVILTGRLRGGRFKGEVEMNFSTCSGSRKLNTRRKP